MTDLDLDGIERHVAALAAHGVPDGPLEGVRDWLRDRRAGKPTRAWYFGCKCSAGHYLWKSDGQRAEYDEPDVHSFYGVGPWPSLDGRLTPTGTTAQSAAALHHADGWTALAMHDYSVDSRGASNAAFIFDADLSWRAALAAAHEWFPEIVERIQAEAPITGPHEFDPSVKR